jgi:hypothetical protein
MFIEEIFKHYKNWLGCQVHFGYSIFFNYGTFVVNVFILNGSQNMKHLFSIQNDACCKQIYILYMWCTIDMLKFLFVMDVTVTEKNVMDATSLINFGKSLSKTFVLNWNIKETMCSKNTAFDSGRPFYCIHHKYFCPFVTSRKSNSVLFFLQHV